MLGLKLPTDPRWIDIANKSIKEILIDHAYCEQKAASSCISLIIQYPDREKLVEMMAPVVTEEWAHFEMVLRELKKRGYSLGEARKDEYVIELFKLKKHGGNREQQLVEDLLVNALIEARSCERFRILSENIADESLKDFYKKLMVSEAGHYVNFVNLAKEYMSEDYVKQRLDELLAGEAEIMKQIGIRLGRVH